MKSHQPGKQYGWKAFQLCVVALSHQVKIAPFNSDAIFGAFQLALKIQKILIGLQLRIIFRYRHQSRKR